MTRRARAVPKVQHLVRWSRYEKILCDRKFNLKKKYNKKDTEANLFLKYIINGKNIALQDYCLLYIIGIFSLRPSYILLLLYVY